MPRWSVAPGSDFRAVLLGSTNENASTHGSHRLHSHHCPGGLFTNLTTSGRINTQVAREIPRLVARKIHSALCQSRILPRV
jgi:hypothetical protein